MKHISNVPFQGRMTIEISKVAYNKQNLTMEICNVTPETDHGNFQRHL